MPLTLKESEEFATEVNILSNINICFEGLLALNFLETHEDYRSSLNDHMENFFGNLEFQKRDKIGNIWYVRCKANSKQEALDEVFNYLANILEGKNITYLNTAISMSLSYFNHKNIDQPMNDPIDYKVIEMLDHKSIEVLKNILEPIEPSFKKWNGESWTLEI